MGGFLNRSLSRREIFLLLLLVIIVLIGLYFLLVHYPVVNELEDIELEKEEVAEDTEIAETTQQVYIKMTNELEEIFKMPPDELTVMPEYDNFETLMVDFNRIFAGTDPSLSFDQVSFNGNIATRVMRFSFTALSYEHARSVLTNLTGTGYRCLLDGLSLTPVDGGDVGSAALRVSGAITFYELYEDGAAPMPGVLTDGQG